MHSVSEAKAQLGRLVDAALGGDEPIFIRRGGKIVQIVAAVMPDPIPVYPMGSLSRTADDFAVSESAASDEEAEPQFR